MNGYGRCAPCEAMGMGNGIGLGAIVMEPLSGGLGNAPNLTLAAGLGAPASMMVGSALTYGGITGIAARSWKAAGTGALLGAGLVGLMSGIGLMGAGAAGGVVTPPADPIAPPSGAEGLSLTGPGVGYAILGGALLAWGGWRAYKKQR